VPCRFRQTNRKEGIHDRSPHHHHRRDKHGA
jgi:hypothetical protein